MDPVTQGLLGAAVSQTFLHRRLKHKAWLVGALAAMAPDLDILIRSADDPLLFLLHHRGFSHSLAFIPIGGLLVGLCFLSLKSYRAQWPWVLLAALLGYATHGLLDAFTSYGTVLYWPFSDQRVAWDSISIIDPVFTMILMAGVLWTAIGESANPTRLTLLLALCYLGFGSFQHHRALEMQQNIAKQRQHSIDKGRVTPTIGNLYHWRSFYINNNKIFVDDIYTPWIGAKYGVRGTMLNQVTFSDLPQEFQNNSQLKRDFDIFNWFSDGYVAKARSTPLTLIDTRYLASVNPVIGLWGIEYPVEKDQNHITWKRFIIVENS